MAARPLIDWDIFDFSSETAEQNSTKLNRKQDLNVLYLFVFLGPIGKTRWQPRPLRSLDIFDFSSETAICLLGPLRTEKHLWRITSAAIAVAMVTGIARCM